MHQYATDDEAAYQRNNEIDSGVNIRVNLSIQPIDHEVDDLLMEEVHRHGTFTKRHNHFILLPSYSTSDPLQNRRSMPVWSYITLAFFSLIKLPKKTNEKTGDLIINIDTKWISPLL